jgi:hypothetical protein
MVKVRQHNCTGPCRNFRRFRVRQVLLLLGACIFLMHRGYGQDVAYELRILNTTLTSATTLEFDIFLLRTGEMPLEYSGGQYHISFNPSISSGALSYTLLGSDLPAALQPANPQVYEDQLRLAAKAPPGPGNGFLISNTPPGTHIAKVRLSSTQPFTARVYELRWRNQADGNPFTKIAAYVDGINREIQDSSRHYAGMLTSVPRQEESVLSAQIRDNGVELRWTGTGGGSIRGYELERMLASAAVRYVGKQGGEPEGAWRPLAFVPAIDSAGVHTYTYYDRTEVRGRVLYRLNRIDRDSSSHSLGFTEVVLELLPQDYGLSQNYPNPFNPTTTFRFAVRTSQRVSSRVYDLLGRLVVTLFDEVAEPHVLYIVSFDGRMLSSGVYLSVLQTAEGVHVKKMVLVR